MGLLCLPDIELILHDILIYSSLTSPECTFLFYLFPVESIFSQDLDGIFQNMIDTVYKETSRHLLEVLHDKYKFMEHLKAMRRYLLLGQGDFIRHLMDLLE